MVQRRLFVKQLMPFATFKLASGQNLKEKGKGKRLLFLAMTREENYDRKIKLILTLEKNNMV